MTADGDDEVASRVEKRDREDRYQEDVSRADMLSGEMGQLYLKVKNKLTPGFLTRFKQSRVYTEIIAEAEIDVEQEKKEIKQVIIAELAKHKIDQASKEKWRLQNIRDALLRDEVIKPEKDLAKAAEALAEVEDYKRRRVLQVAEAQAMADLAQKLSEEKTEEEDAKRRTNLTIYWGKNAKIFETEAAVTKEANRQRTTQEYKEAVDGTYEEWVNREFQRTRMQVEAPGYLDNHDTSPQGIRFGLFGRSGRNTDPDGQGEELMYAAGTGKNFEYRPEVDAHDVKVFSSEPNTLYEERNLDLMDSVGDTTQQKVLYEALKRDSKMFSDAMERMCQMREIVERDIFQVKQEVSLDGLNLLGPPRRQPVKSEMETTQDRRERMHTLETKAKDLQYSIDVSDKKKRGVEAQMLTLARSIAVGKETNKQLDEEVRQVNGDLGMLPMIIGRGLQTVKGLNTNTGRPKEFMDAVRHQSKFIGIKDMGQTAQKIHRERGVLDQKLWIERMGSNAVKSDAERVNNKLMDISDRIKYSKFEATKLNVVDSISVFQQKDVQLNKTRSRLLGLLPWYCNIDPRFSSGDIGRYRSSASLGAISFQPPLTEKEKKELETPEEVAIRRDLENGLILRSGQTGYAVGFLNLPKDSVWNIIITILVKIGEGDGGDMDNRHTGTNTPGSPVSPGSPSTPGMFHANSMGTTESSSPADPKAFENDFISVRLGTDFGTMSQVGVYYNKVNKDTGTVLYDVKHTMKGKTVAFRFDFSSMSGSRVCRLAVETGRYEEYHMADLECFPDRHIVGREIVLSSFVKMIRLNEAQGKLKETDMLEELVKAEESKGDTWDSSIFFKTPQRFKKHLFLRILKAEILLQLQQTKNRIAAAEVEAKILADKPKEEDDDVMPEQDDDNGRGIDMSDREDQTHRLNRSMQQYINRKRRLQVPIVEAGMDLIGKRVAIYDEGTNSWRLHLIRDCNLVWVENGTIAYVTHVLQETDEYQRHIGGEYLCDLKTVRYVASTRPPAQDNASTKYLAKKGRAALRLDQLNKQADKLTEEGQDEYQDFKYEEEQHLEADRRMFRKDLRDNNEISARKYMETDPHAKALVAKLARNMKVKVRDENGMVNAIRSQALAQATTEALFIENRIEQRKAELISAFKEKEEASYERIEDERVILDEILDRGLATINVERAAIHAKIDAWRYTEGNVLLSRVRFDPQEFSKALPTPSVHCEHIKAKAWGDEYGNGLKCLGCGKDLTNLDEEDSQLKGHGSGSAPWLTDALDRHRANEETFKFKSSEELRIVEEERRKLEKELREIDEQECYFFDFSGLKAMYEFDRRHRKTIKNSGVFRQGLQWTVDEIVTYENTTIEKEKIRLDKEGIVEEDAMRGFDPLESVPKPASSYRAIQERHKAQYQDMLHAIGRLLNFNKRIAILKEERLDLLDDRSLYNGTLSLLQMDTFNSEVSTKALEADLDKATNLLVVYDNMKQIVHEGKLLLSKAERDTKRADMSRCGVWDDVQEAHVNVSFLHDETAALLKAKFILDDKLEAVVQLVTQKKELFKAYKAKFLEAQALALSTLHLQPGEAVTTKYGPGWICVFRPEDDMIMATLNFCYPPAKVWISVKEIIDADNARQDGEKKLMDLEDNLTRKVSNLERIRRKKEIYQMGLEENVKGVYEFLDMNVQEGIDAQAAVEKAVQGSFIVLQSARFAKIQKDTLTAVTTQWKDRIQDKIADYTGPPTGKPKMPSHWAIHKKKLELNQQLKQTFLKKAATKAEREIKRKLLADRTAWLANYSFQQLMEDTINVMIAEVALESLKDGRAAKEAAERVSGILFPIPIWMQFGAYESLANSWKARKEFLRAEIAKGKGNSHTVVKLAEAPVSVINSDKARALRHSKNAELRRQRAMNAEMADEETHCRKVYKTELLKALAERRLMREEDENSKIIEVEMKKLADASVNAYVTAATAGKLRMEAEEEAAVNTAYERRRGNLKDQTVERRKREEDRARMVIEDDRSKLVRANYVIAQAEIKLSKEFEATDSLEEASVGAGSISKASLQSLTNNKIALQKDDDTLSNRSSEEDVFVALPFWLDTPREWESWTFAQQKLHIQRETNMRKRQLIVKKKIAREMVRLERMEKDSYIAWQKQFQLVELTSNESELKMMILEEEMLDAEASLIDVQNNQRKLFIFCRLKGEAELKAKTDLKKKEELGRRRDKELLDAQKWWKICQVKQKERNRLIKRVHENCKYIDTSSTCGFQQRFSTEVLRDDMYVRYFREVACNIVIRAEMIAIERRLMKVQEKLTINKADLMDRLAYVKINSSDIQREELLRSRRSTLNEKFFPLNRYRILKERFSSWIRYFQWNRGHREAFVIKYEILKRQMDIDRQFKAQLQIANAPPLPKKITVTNTKNFTVMQRHRERPVQCRSCHAFYLESQNNSLSCRLHSKSYLLQCPKTCLTPGGTSLCTSHRLRRWGCCDATTVDAVGCCLRAHLPPAFDPIYDKLMVKINERDFDENEMLDEKIELSRMMDYSSELQKINYRQVSVVEDAVSKDRALVARYTGLL